MGATSEVQAAALLPPRRGSVWAVTVDATARAYDLSKLALGGSPAPEAAGSRAKHCVLFLSADTNDVYFYFDTATGVALNDAATQAAGAGAVVMADAHGAVIKAGTILRVRIDRAQDKFIQLKAVTTSGVLRMWAGSEET